MSSPTPAELDLQVESTDAGPVIHLRGELDLASAPTLSVTVAEAASTGTEAVTLDLSAVTFIDSSALRTLVVSGRQLAQRGGVLQIGPRSVVVARVLSMTRLDEQADSFLVLPVPAEPSPSR
jgi:anti-anti-sigma factor